MAGHWAFIVGIIGNVSSFLVYLAPVPTFYQVYRKRTTGGFQSVPYSVALFSAMLWIFYAFVKTNSILLITINSTGCAIEMIYIIMYLVYAPRSARIFTAKIILLLNVGLFSLILLSTLLLSKGSKRVKVLGWICMCFSASVFAAPLSIIRQVVRTRSVEYMPFTLSLFLTISAVAWFGYGLLTNDFYVMFPNVLGFAFGAVQMLLYVVYKYMVKKVVVEPAVLEHIVAIDVQKAGVELQVPAEAISDSKEAVKANEETNGRDKGKKGEEDGLEISPA
ncbi:bidirectional sugar transporter SWEET14 [Elaeis guineensis]|uniref:Bidirectional sugar transporter SWEET n=1 Tax=Elaeis guineensis var. tenera TaxID=51953 RepID=A0A6I9RQL4_ELAGV|nr:bidirectional sugar transporter SWEET14 isoform X1 [Elaeis guineensis]